MELLLLALLPYLIGLAANERTAAIQKRRRQKLVKVLQDEDTIQTALASRRSLEDELRAACTELARNREQLGVTKQEEPLWQLLSDDPFLSDLTEWFMAGGIEEGQAVQARLTRTMESALAQGGASSDQITFLKSDYFDALNKTLVSHPSLAHWRHQMSLDYLRQQVAILRQHAGEAAGVYSPEKQQAALDHYCEQALTAWDIIDLSNLPEGDIHIATQKLLLRQLYMPLRLTVQPADRTKDDSAQLAQLEQQRDTRRHREAGHLLPGESELRYRDVPQLPVGECLSTSRRLVVLGDPGGGKTTMLRWMATAYLLRYSEQPATDDIPDIHTLPDQHWIPVLIRCRDIGPEDLCRCFTDFLRQHLHKTALLPRDADVMQAVILDRMAQGEALLLVDGLDEITDPDVRMMFCQELERTATRYPNAPIVVTSRIVGYRDMPYRMGSDFQHGVIADLNREDKNLFAKRWIEVTEQHRPDDERAKRCQELIAALHSSNRIERLTGNPMLLTTLALVKRKVGKLPNRRTKLYAEAVSVLLNWNPRLYETIDEDEALPQLEYLAYEMCRRGVQQLPDDDVLDLLDKLRIEYPNIRAIQGREPQAFLDLLEARSSILIKGGGIWQENRTQEKAVWEFRHLTFQEYLAARALIDGRYPDRDKAQTLATQVAPLAGVVKKSKHPQRWPPEDEEVPESWREALRLVVADCQDDDVDDVLLAILCPASEKAPGTTYRPTAVLAALCLADEPNVSEATASRVLAAFVNLIDDTDGNGPTITSSLDNAAIEVANSMWMSLLKRHMIEEFLRRPSELRTSVGGLCSTVEFTMWRRSGHSAEQWLSQMPKHLKSRDRIEAMSAALAVMVLAYEGHAGVAPGLVEALLALLDKGGPESHAAAWALGWLSLGGRRGVDGRKGSSRARRWKPNKKQLQSLIETSSRLPGAEIAARRWLCSILGASGSKQALQPLLQHLDDPHRDIRCKVVEALGQLGDERAVEPLLQHLDDPDQDVRRNVVEALGQLGDERAVEPLLQHLGDQDEDVRHKVAKVLGQLGGKRAVEPLLQHLDGPDGVLRVAAAVALAQLNDARGHATLRRSLSHERSSIRQAAFAGLALTRNSTEKTLLSRDVDGISPWLDPAEPISLSRVAACADKLDLTRDEVQSIYEKLADEFHLKLD
jgi:HEAT repeat protein